LPRFFRIDEEICDWETEQEIKTPSIREYLNEQDVQKGPPEEPTREKTEIKIVKPLKKDVSVEAYVTKIDRPWTLEFEIKFVIELTREYVNKFRPVAKHKEEYRDWGDYPQQIVSFLQDLEKKFNLGPVKRQINQLKDRIDNKYFSRFPIWEWSTPDIEFVGGQETIKDFFMLGGEVETHDDYGVGTAKSVSFQSRAGDPFSVGYRATFLLPKKVDSDSLVNKYVSAKTEEFQKELLNLPLFNSNENFKLRPPGAIEEK